MVMMKGRWGVHCRWGRVCTLHLWTSLKEDSEGLAWKTTAAQGEGKGQWECFISAVASIAVRYAHTAWFHVCAAVFRPGELFVSGLSFPLLMKGIFSFTESCGVQDSHHLHRSDRELALIDVSHNLMTDCQLNNLTFKWQEYSKGYSLAWWQRSVRNCHQLSLKYITCWIWNICTYFSSVSL